MSKRPLKLFAGFHVWQSAIIFLTILLAASLLASSCSLLPQETQTSENDTTTTTEEPAASSETTETTAEPTTIETTPEPTLPAPTPALPSEPVVEDYFGPLPEAEQYVELRRNEARALYIGAAANIDATLEIIRATEVNAVVLDLKESDGIKYASNVQLAIDSGSVKPAFNLGDVVSRLHAEDVIVIGRIVCFKDPILAEARPDISIKDSSGKSLFFTNEGSKPFVSPFNQEVWQYNIDIALEAIEHGVDEIQFDYVRFPTGGTTTGNKPYFGPEGEVPTRVQAINRFLQTSKIYIQDERGIPLGADVFGIIITSDLDGSNIGQDWTTVGLSGIDSVSPMIYPSHYANDSTSHYTGNGKGSMINGVHFTKPDHKPYEVMYNALMAGQEATEQPAYAVNRPYLQAFTAAYLPSGYYIDYGPAEIKAQIQAIYDAGYKEWICWNPRAQYPIAAFDPES